MVRITDIHALFAAICFMLALPVSAGNSPDVVLKTVKQMAVNEEKLNSHHGEEQFSSLETIYADNIVIPQEHLGMNGKAIYPRIKRMADGQYIMFCQAGKIASRIYYYTSPDLITWSNGTLLFEPYKTETPMGNDIRRFSTADAVVLPDGEILVVCSYRANDAYRHGVGCGLMLRRSSDNGKTWTKEVSIYEGANWEPYLLYLPDGRIQCYFTDCIPAIKNSGTSVIVSDDNGYTWKDYKRVCRQFKYVQDGVNIYTDQMPCFRVLNDGKTLLGFLEARLEPEGPGTESIFKMSVIRNGGLDWEALGESREGPSDRQTNVVAGCAGYVASFPSGETAISCNIARKFSIKLGNAEGTVFNGRSWDEDWFVPFEGRGYWGSLETVAPHLLVGAMHCDDGIQIALMYLNHRIDAVRSKVRVDGNPAEWKHGDALFIGSDSPAQSVFRAANDGRNLYILSETSGAESIEISVCGPNGKMIKVSEDAPQSVGVCSLEGKTQDGRPGFAKEISIPLKMLGAKKGDNLRFNAVVRSGEIEDSFTGVDARNPQTWMLINLK
ncbi:MAG: sialidase family protein [Candidatus Cryptobacteroides sp.]